MRAYGTRFFILYKAIFIVLKNLHLLAPHRKMFKSGYMKNVLILILLLTGMISYLYDRYASRSPPGNEPGEVLESPMTAEPLPEREPEPVPTASPSPTPTPEPEPEPEPTPGFTAEEFREELRAALKAEIAEEIKAELAAERQLEVSQPTATPEPAVEMPVVKITSQPKPKHSAADIAAMQEHLRALDRQISVMRQVIQTHEQQISAENNRLLQWRNSLRGKYSGENFSITKYRAELQGIKAAEFALSNERSLQKKRRYKLSQTESELQIKKVYLQQVRDNQ